MPEMSPMTDAATRVPFPTVIELPDVAPFVDENSGGVELLLTCLDLSCEAFDDCLVDCNVVL